jgi:hypothetical protein
MYWQHPKPLVCRGQQNLTQLTQHYKEHSTLQDADSIKCVAASMLWRQRGKWHAGMRSAFLHAVGDHGDLMCSALGSHAWNQSANPCCTQLTTDLKRAAATWAIAPVFCSQRMPQTLIENRLHRGRMHMGTRTSVLVSAHATWNTLCHCAAAACMSCTRHT